MSLNTQSRWKLLITLMNDGFYVLQDYRFVYINPAFEKMLGVKSADLIGRRLEEVIQPDMRQLALKHYDNRLQGLPSPKHYEITLQRLDNGDAIEVWLEIEKVQDDDGQISVAATVRNIGPYKSLKQELSDTRSQLNTILDNMADTIYQTNMQGEVTLISSNVSALLGYTENELVGTRLADYYWSPEERQKVVKAITDNNGVVTNVEAILKRKDGTPVWISTNAYVKKNEQGEPVSIEGLARDVSRQKELEQKLEKLALTDSLTNLPNRRALMDELHLRFTESRENNTELSVIYFDVNDFKQVNDQYGHLTGDNLLCHIALNLHIHVTHQSMLGRLSGDEFLFILPESGAEQAVKLARHIIHDMKQKPLMMEQNKIPISIAFGISELKKKDKNEYSLLDRADKAMYLAKKGVMQFEVM